MPQVHVNGIHLEYESFGDTRDPVMLLIMGLGAQLTRWTIPFCEKLVARGYRVIRFDNRDVGLSSKFDAAGVPDLGQIMAARFTGVQAKLPYTLHDMAADAVGLLDALAIAKAHVVGASMGGMIAQQVAAEYPERVLSLTSIMSTTGNPALPPPTAAAASVLMSRYPNLDDHAAYVEHGLHALRTISSPGFPFDETATRERILSDALRGYSATGFGRQLAALAASGDRRNHLRSIKAPTMIIHGENDPLVPVAAGRDTAAAIPGAELRVFAGMGHDLPAALYDKIIDAIVSVAARAS
ncbi:MAG: alpha/beta hydrolase [Steroidobacteraceae bacterium]